MSRNSYGLWLGIGYEIPTFVEIVQEGVILSAIKQSYGGCVQEGMVSWVYNLHTKEAYGYVSEKEGKNLRAVDGKLTVIDRERLRFTWIKFPTGTDGSDVIFYRDQPL